MIEFNLSQYSQSGNSQVSSPYLEDSTLQNNSLTVASSASGNASRTIPLTPPRSELYRVLPVIPSALPGQPSLIPKDTGVTRYVVITPNGIGVDVTNNSSARADVRNGSRASSVMFDLSGDQPSFLENDDSYYRSSRRSGYSSHRSHSHYSHSSYRRRRKLVNESVGEQVQEFSDESRTVEGLSESSSVVEETAPLLSRRV